jgi:lipid II isoglutaminyl synthase (glutamine-hydrolysing)
MNTVVIFIAKITGFLIKLFSLGSGATWPGEIALRLSPKIITHFAKQKITTIVVAGTNGKTTTAKMIETILTGSGKRVVRNATGANLDNGIVSTFLTASDVSGRLTAQYFIFEVDEATLPNVIHLLHPKIIVLLNLFRDQLDRYGEVDTIAEKWLNTLNDYSKSGSYQVLVNADDPQLGYIGQTIKNGVTFFGLEDPKLFLQKMQHATDSIYCPKCGNRLTFGGVYFSHLGKYACGQCGFTHPDTAVSSKDVTSPLEGIYNIYNTMGATLVAQTVGINREQIKESLASFTPAFGRMEQTEYRNKPVRILLSKNPTGFNESIRTVLSSNHTGPLLLVLNDRIPDGTDVSWIWDVDFEVLASTKQTIVVSGDRVYDLATRLKYAGVPPEKIDAQEDLSTALDYAVKGVAGTESLWVLATYSAMLDVRKIIVGRKIL